MIPLFSSHFSFQKSILTLDEPKKEELKDNTPISVFDIALKHELKDVYLCETSMSGFVEAWKLSQKLKINLRYGFKVICCDDLNDKSEKSLQSEHKIIIWLNNSNGYKNLVKLVTRAQTDGFYYVPRIDCKTLAENWSDDLSLCCPFYDSFIFNNTLNNNLCIPNFPVAPTLFVEDNNLPFDSIIQDKVSEVAAYDKLNVERVKSIFYYKRLHFPAYLTFRCIAGRTTLSKPNLNGMSSQEFCFESWLENQ